MKKLTSILAIVIGLTIAAVPWLGLPYQAADASHAHPQSDTQHIYGLHWSSPNHGLWDEDYCAQSYDYSVITTEALQAKLQTLIYNAGWDGIGSGNVDIWPTAYSCESYIPNDSDVEVRLSIISSTTSVCGFEVSCVKFAWPYYVNSQIKDYFQGVVWLKTFHVNPLSSDSATATINHEFGHVLGLLDGGGADCGISIMHQLDYCSPQPPYVLWPNQADKDSVVNNMMPAH